MKVALISLGCSKNLVDSEIMLGFLKKAGFTLKDDPIDADVAIINTCAFVKEAKEEAIEAIFNLVRLKKSGVLKKIIVAGCLPQRYKGTLPDLLSEVDGFLGPGSIDKVAAVIKKVFKNTQTQIYGDNHYLYKNSTPRISLTPKHYAYVKIADGCDNHCSYCVIPQIRGSYRSRKMESIVKEVETLATSGVKEVNLISQDSTFYGQDIYKRFSLDLLLKKLVKINGIKWIRILYSHPLHFNRSLLEIIRDEPKICKYLDMPIQHINNTILKLMGRKVTSIQIKRLIADMRRTIPDVALRTTLIVGFPQETEYRFKELYNFVKEVEFDRLGVFTYSAEEDTRAALLKGQIPEKLKEKRRNKIMRLQQKIVEKKHSYLVGREREVLIDQAQGKGPACGRSQFDAPDVDGLVYVNGKNIKVGDILRVKITDNMLYDLIGKKL